MNKWAFLFSSGLWHFHCSCAHPRILNHPNFCPLPVFLIWSPEWPLKGDCFHSWLVGETLLIEYATNACSTLSWPLWLFNNSFIPHLLMPNHIPYSSCSKLPALSSSPSPIPAFHSQGMTSPPSLLRSLRPTDRELLHIPSQPSPHSHLKCFQLSGRHASSPCQS